MKNEMHKGVSAALAAIEDELDRRKERSRLITAADGGGGGGNHLPGRTRKVRDVPASRRREQAARRSRRANR